MSGRLTRRTADRHRRARHCRCRSARALEKLQVARGHGRCIRSVGEASQQRSVHHRFGILRGGAVHVQDVGGHSGRSGKLCLGIDPVDAEVLGGERRTRVRDRLPGQIRDARRYLETGRRDRVGRSRLQVRVRREVDGLLRVGVVDGGRVLSGQDRRRHRSPGRVLQDHVRPVDRARIDASLEDEPGVGCRRRADQIGVRRSYIPDERLRRRSLARERARQRQRRRVGSEVVARPGTQCEGSVPALQRPRHVDDILDSRLPVRVAVLAGDDVDLPAISAARSEIEDPERAPVRLAGDGDGPDAAGAEGRDDEEGGIVRRLLVARRGDRIEVLHESWGGFVEPGEEPRVRVLESRRQDLES